MIAINKSNFGITEIKVDANSCCFYNNKILIASSSGVYSLSGKGSSFSISTGYIPAGAVVSPLECYTFGDTPKTCLISSENMKDIPALVLNQKIHLPKGMRAKFLKLEFSWENLEVNNGFVILLAVSKRYVR